jgi:hypothetical protein
MGDKSALPYLIEELISCSIREIVIPRDTVAAGYATTLPDAYKAWIRIVHDDRAFNLSEQVLRLLKQDVCSNPDKYERPEYHDYITPSMEKAVEQLAYYDIPRLMMGFVYQTAIPLDPTEMRKRCALLRPVLRNPEIRVIFASLEGILATYSNVTLDGIHCTSRDNGRLAERLECLLKSDDYREMSGKAYLVGVPNRLPEALAALRFLMKSLIANDHIRRWFSVGTKVIAAATHLPLADSEFADALLDKKYLPPVVALDEPWNRAYQAFIQETIGQTKEELAQQGGAEVRLPAAQPTAPHR